MAASCFSRHTSPRMWAVDADTGWTEKSQRVSFKLRHVKQRTKHAAAGHQNRAEQSRRSYPYVSWVQQEISEGSVVFRGENMVLSVNNVQTQRAELFHLHWLPSVLPGLKKVPEEEKHNAGSEDSWEERWRTFQHLSMRWSGFTVCNILSASHLID